MIVLLPETFAPTPNRRPPGLVDQVESPQADAGCNEPETLGHRQGSREPLYIFTAAPTGRSTRTLVTPGRPRTHRPAPVQKKLGYPIADAIQGQGWEQPPGRGEGSGMSWLRHHDRYGT
jgi:hypothetical protein